MENVETVEKLGDGVRAGRSRRRGGSTVELVTEITEDKPGEAIAWESEPESDIATEGRVEFLDAAPGRGTMVRLTMRYDPPGGIVGKGRRQASCSASPTSRRAATSAASSS